MFKKKFYSKTFWITIFTIVFILLSPIILWPLILTIEAYSALLNINLNKISKSLTVIGTFLSGLGSIIIALIANKGIDSYETYKLIEDNKIKEREKNAVLLFHQKINEILDNVYEIVIRPNLYESPGYYPNQKLPEQTKNTKINIHRPARLLYDNITELTKIFKTQIIFITNSEKRLLATNLFTNSKNCIQDIILHFNAKNHPDMKEILKDHKSLNDCKKELKNLLNQAKL